MISIDTGAWDSSIAGGDEARKKREAEREKRRKQMEESYLKEQEQQKKKQEAMERRAREEALEVEKENRREEERLRKERSKKHAEQESSSEEKQLEAAIAAAKAVKQERSNALQRAARQSLGPSRSQPKQQGKSSRGRGSNVAGMSSLQKGERAKRGRVKVNPVTGALVHVDDSEDDGKVREGCLRLDKKYMNAALAAGLGAGNGMYGHIGALRKELNSDRNTGSRPRDGPSHSRESAAAAMRRGSNSGSMSRVKTENVGGTVVHSITSKTSNPRRKQLKKNNAFFRQQAGSHDLGGNPIRGDQKRPPKKRSNVKRMVQGRSTSVKGSRGKGSLYMKEKGVVATLGGATSAASQRRAENRSNEVAAERQQQRLEQRAPKRQPRRVAISRKLGGGGSGGGQPQDREAMRAARLAALERRGLA